MTITYETAKLIKDFLKDSAPEPMVCFYWTRNSRTKRECLIGFTDGKPSRYPAYQLHDLLSRPFLYALEKLTPKFKSYDERGHDIAECYMDGGLPAVEAELVRMMGKK